MSKDEILPFLLWSEHHRIACSPTNGHSLHAMYTLGSWKTEKHKVSLFMGQLKLWFINFIQMGYMLLSLTRLFGGEQSQMCSTVALNQQGNSITRDLLPTNSEANTTILCIYILDNRFPMSLSTIWGNHLPFNFILKFPTTVKPFIFAPLLFR